MDVPFLAHLEILSSAFFQIFWNFVRIIRPYFLTTWNRNCNERKYVANKWVELTRERERIILLPLITWKSLVEKWKKKRWQRSFLRDELITVRAVRKNVCVRWKFQFQQRREVTFVSEQIVSIRFPKIPFKPTILYIYIYRGKISRGDKDLVETKEHNFAS